VAAQPQAWTVFARPNTGIVDSNPTEGMDVLLHLSYVCVVLCSLWPCVGLIPHPRRPTDCLRIKKLKWNKAFHGCPMLQSEGNRKERDFVHSTWPSTSHVMRLVYIWIRITPYAFASLLFKIILKMFFLHLSSHGSITPTKCCYYKLLTPDIFS
jgi:hypothetical protein